MPIKRVTYTSLAALDLDEEQLLAIHQAARDLNAIDGITGMLVFNGTHFLQFVEGSEQAVDDLIERIRRDPRHSGFEIRDTSRSDERLFGLWSMELVRVRSRLLHAREDLQALLPPALPAPVRERITAMVDTISAEVEL